ncbi:tumor necrosis factor receptor superfamily member 4 [Pempheris klunzingeri]|uniref:tumor necrosis factor receptor superfamily member 4 n=1 Tax=Pempheris klunzingeri TaxID=3127111 RepID=UPI00397F3A8E
MVLLKLLIFTLTFYDLIVNLDACPKGTKVSLRGTGCESCPDGYFQPEENHSQKCKVCTRCDESWGSFVKEECTKEKDTKCQCRRNFLPIEKDSCTCKCATGFGIKDGECSKCESGYFSTRINSPCQKWKECKSTGVNISGNATSDAICNEKKLTTYITTVPTSNKTVSLITHLKTHPKHEGTETQKIRTTTTSAPGHVHTPVDKMQPLHPSTTGNHTLGMALLIFGIVGLLVLTAVTCKLYTTACVLRKPSMKTHDSLCRRPVEESGNSSLSPLKLNSGEPQGECLNV